MHKGGFSLLEFFIFIGALVILGVILLLVSNPAEFLAEYRDSQRMSDLNNFRADLVSYLSSVPSVDICEVEDNMDFPKLPIDPVNNDKYFYDYACDNTTKTFKISANMESARYSQGGSDDVESTDAGSQPDIYEVGTDLSL